jgi:Fic family protein
MTAAGSEVSITFGGRPARAWLPAPLAARDLALETRSTRAAERAVGSISRMSDRIGRPLEPLARLLLRAEGVASSDIEGLRAPVAEVALAEIDPTATTTTAAWIADNLAALDQCLAHAATAAALDAGVLHAWHRRLMRHGSLPPDLIGRFRDRQGWIGGYSPQTAAYVPPPAGEIELLMADLVRYINGTEADPVTRAAVAHAQFETVHPYGDGNGRIGRLVVLWVIVRSLRIPTPPPVSVLIARDAGGYISGLHRFRTGHVGPWVEWFAGVVERSANGTHDWAARVDEVIAGWRGRVADRRADATARKLLELLPSHPVVSAELGAKVLGVSDTAARNALELLAERGIVTKLSTRSQSRGRPRRWWVAAELDRLVGAWPT